MVVLNAGKIEQVGSAVEVYERPSTRFVFDFLGDTNVFTLVRSCGGFAVRDSCWHLPKDMFDDGTEAGALYVRPHDFEIVADDVPGIDATIRQAQRTGPFIRIAAACPDGSAALDLEFPHLNGAAARLAAGDRVRVAPLHYRVFANCRG